MKVRAVLFMFRSAEHRLGLGWEALGNLPGRCPAFDVVARMDLRLWDSLVIFAA
jgi:hypothetical protein